MRYLLRMTGAAVVAAYRGPGRVGQPQDDQARALAMQALTTRTM